MSQPPRPVVEVYPSSMAESRRPELVEHAYGVVEKLGERVRLPPVFPLRERAVVHTHEWLAPIIYRFDEASGAILVQDVLPPAPYAQYVIESVGGERVRKQTTVGVIYVNTRPVHLVVDETYSGLVREKLRAGLILSRVRVQVRDVTKFVLELWRRYGAVSPEGLVHEVRQAFKKVAQRMMPETSIEDLLARPASVEEGVASSLREAVAAYGVELLDAEVKTVVSDEAYEYYFWHVVNEVPVEYAYLLRLVRSIPERVLEHAPSAVSLVVAALLSRAAPGLASLLARAVEEAVEPARGEAATPSSSS